MDTNPNVQRPKSSFIPGPGRQVHFALDAEMAATLTLKRALLVAAVEEALGPVRTEETQVVGMPRPVVFSEGDYVAATIAHVFDDGNCDLILTVALPSEVLCVFDVPHAYGPRGYLYYTELPKPEPVPVLATESQDESRAPNTDDVF